MKTRRMSLCLSLGFMPFLVGCVEDAKADGKNNPDEKAKADSVPPDAAKKSKKAPLEFSELPVNDPLVANAIQAREEITELEEELLEQLDELRSALASAKADPDRMRDSVEQFIDLTKAMRENTVKANDALNAVSEKTSELSRSSRHLASSYRALAELFRKKARDYSEKKLREQLLGFAKDYDDVAKSIPERTKTIEAVQKKLPLLKRKVKEVNSFLTDAVAFLNTHPGMGADPRERYSAEFESFAVTFTEWIHVLDELRNALRERAISKVIQDSYRKEVVALQTLEKAKREEQARIERFKQEEITKAEQAKSDEESRLAKLAADEQKQLDVERERLAKAETETTPAIISPSVVSAGSYQPVTYYPQGCPQHVVGQTARPCRLRLFPIFPRCQ